MYLRGSSSFQRVWDKTKNGGSTSRSRCYHPSPTIYMLSFPSSRCSLVDRMLATTAFSHFLPHLIICLCIINARSVIAFPGLFMQRRLPGRCSLDDYSSIHRILYRASRYSRSRVVYYCRSCGIHGRETSDRK